MTAELLCPALSIYAAIGAGLAIWASDDDIPEDAGAAWFVFCVVLGPMIFAYLWLFEWRDDR